MAQHVHIAGWLVQVQRSAQVLLQLLRRGSDKTYSACGCGLKTGTKPLLFITKAAISCSSPGGVRKQQQTTTNHRSKLQLFESSKPGRAIYGDSVSNERPQLQKQSAHNCWQREGVQEVSNARATIVTGVAGEGAGLRAVAGCFTCPSRGGGGGGATRGCSSRSSRGCRSNHRTARHHRPAGCGRRQCPRQPRSASCRRQW